MHQDRQGPTAHDYSPGPGLRKAHHRPRAARRASVEPGFEPSMLAGSTTLAGTRGPSGGWPAQGSTRTRWKHRSSRQPCLRGRAVLALLCLVDQLAGTPQQQARVRERCRAAWPVARHEPSAAMLANDLPAKVLDTHVQRTAADRALLQEIRLLSHPGNSFYRLPPWPRIARAHSARAIRRPQGQGRLVDPCHPKGIHATPNRHGWQQLASTAYTPQQVAKAASLPVSGKPTAAAPSGKSESGLPATP